MLEVLTALPLMQRAFPLLTHRCHRRQRAVIITMLPGSAGLDPRGDLGTSLVKVIEMRETEDFCPGREEELLCFV